MTVLLRTADFANYAGPLAHPTVRLGLGHPSRVVAAGYAVELGNPALTRQFSPAELDCLTALYDYFIVRGSLETQALVALAQEQLGALADRGALRSAYLWAYGTAAPATTAQIFIDNFGAYVSARILWIDAEDLVSFAGLSEQQGYDWHLAAWQVARDNGWTPGIYSNPYAWGVITGGRPIPSDVVQGLASWGTPPDLNVGTIDGRPGSVAWHQYAPSVLQCGIYVDEGVSDQEVIMVSTEQVPPPTPETQYASEEDLQRLNEATVARFTGLGELAPLMRQAADVVEANTGTSPPATSSTATTTGSWSSYALTAGASSGEILLPPPPARVVNEPISWPQLLGSWADLAVTFLLAALPGIVTYLSGVGALTPRVIVSLGLSAIVAGLLAVQHATGSAPLMLRLRAMGQIEK